MPTTITSSRLLNLRIVMDAKQIFPDDPGQGQPVYVETHDGKFFASWNCATCEGELSCGDYQLNHNQLNWLNTQDEFVEAWMLEHGV